MNHTESEYIDIGYRYEKAQTPDRGRAIASTIRAMLQSEAPIDQIEARRLIDQGRQEARHR